MLQLITEFITLFKSQHSYISFDENSKEIRKEIIDLLESDKSLDWCVNMFQDYLLSQGECDVVE